MSSWSDGQECPPIRALRVDPFPVFFSMLLTWEDVA